MMNKNDDMFDIYQIKPGSAFRDYGFENMEKLEARGLKVEYLNYDFKYSDQLKDGMSLEDIYTKFNVDRPEDFQGHSLSVSDMVVLVKDGKATAHFVDSFGFKEVPEFAGDRDKARRSRSSVLASLKENPSKVHRKEPVQKKQKSNGLDER